MESRNLRVVATSLWIALLVLAGCSNSTSSDEDTQRSTTTTLSPQMIAKQDCITTISQMVDNGINTMISNPGRTDQVLNSYMLQYGPESDTFKVFMRVYLAIAQRVGQIGTAKASTEAVNMITDECSKLHPVPTSTIAKTTTTKAANETSGKSAGTAVAPAQLSDKCTTGEIRAGLPVVECVIAAWQSGKLATTPALAIDASARAALASFPPPSTIDPLGCVELDTRTADAGAVPGSAGSTSYADIGCTFRLDGGRQLKVTLITTGASLGSRVSKIEMSD